VTTTQFPWLEPLATVRAGVLEVASYQAGPADGGHSSFLPNVRQVLGKGILMSAASSRPPTPEGPGSVSGAPNLPAGFTDTFTSRYIDAGGLRQHAVIGGEGPPLLLVHGWPQTWYAWRMVMPTLEKPWNWQ
jgi:hypothetical protein